MYHFVGTNEEAHVLLDVSQATGLEDHCQTNITKKKHSLMGFFSPKLNNCGESCSVGQKCSKTEAVFKFHFTFE